jgi:hypothetical protein
MVDLRIQQSAMPQPAPVASDGQNGGARREQQQPRRQREHPGAEELALALAEDGRSAMEAHYEEDADGTPRIRILDTARGETVAVVTPDEIRLLSEHIGLPAGLLVRTQR